MALGGLATRTLAAARDKQLSQPQRSGIEYVVALIMDPRSGKTVRYAAC